MDNDFAVGETKGLENGDLLALQSQETGKNRIAHECSHTQEHDRKANGYRGQNPDFIRNTDVRRVITTTVGAPAAISVKEAIQTRRLPAVRLLPAPE